MEPVADVQDPGPERDFVPSQPGRISAAVQPLVVVEHDLCDVGEARYLRHDFVAEARMLADLSHLCISELACFLEVCLRHTYLPDIVDQPGKADGALDIRDQP
ncbi:MAG: hypothetical protein H5T95_14315 [Firmicutes bacterium]|nr:hypothetical protein [Bacillota bacterium]